MTIYNLYIKEVAMFNLGEDKVSDQCFKMGANPFIEFSGNIDELKKVISDEFNIVERSGCIYQVIGYENVMDLDDLARQSESLAMDYLSQPEVFCSPEIERETIVFMA